MTSVGINGFGRFGMHLLRYWMINSPKAKFSIDFINDDHLSLETVVEIIKKDPYFDFKDRVHINNDFLVVEIANKFHTITYTNLPLGEISWLGEPTIFLECSGKHAEAKDWKVITRGNTRQVIVSATSWQAAKILIYGYNHEQELDGTSVISYGSCTVNAFIPLAASIDREFGVLDADVNVIHNVPHYKIRSFNTLQRKLCSLEKVAPRLLGFITENNFKVNYTLVPHTGVSMIDYRFRLKNPHSADAIVAYLGHEVEKGGLRDIYGMKQADDGPESHKFTPYSAVLIENTISLVGDNLYIQAYFDNENSANRYFDVVNYLCEKL